MAAIEQSQLNGYFYNILFIVHSAMELKYHPLSAFVSVMPRFNENIDSVLWYIISVCLHSDKNMLLHIRHCAVPLSWWRQPLLICINVTQFRVTMDVYARLVLSGKKLDSLRRQRRWRGFLAPWFQVTEQCEEMERVSARRMGGSRSERERRGQHPETRAHHSHRHVSHRTHCFQPLSSFTARAGRARNRVTKSQDGLGTMVGGGDAGFRVFRISVLRSLNLAI